MSDQETERLLKLVLGCIDELGAKLHMVASSPAVVASWTPKAFKHNINRVAPGYGYPEFDGKDTIVVSACPLDGASEWYAWVENINRCRQSLGLEQYRLAISHGAK